MYFNLNEHIFNTNLLNRENLGNNFRNLGCFDGAMAPYCLYSRKDLEFKFNELQVNYKYLVLSIDETSIESDVQINE